MCGPFAGPDYRMQRGEYLLRGLKRVQECHSQRWSMIVAVEMPKVGDDKSTSGIRKMIDPSSFSFKWKIHIL